MAIEYWSNLIEYYHHNSRINRKKLKIFNTNTNVLLTIKKYYYLLVLVIFLWCHMMWLVEEGRECPIFLGTDSVLSLWRQVRKCRQNSMFWGMGGCFYLFILFWTWPFILLISSEMVGCPLSKSVKVDSVTQCKQGCPLKCSLKQR